MPVPFITLTTDLGTKDYYIGAMKGVILKINPSAIIVDITHDIRPYDIVQAAYVLDSASKCFPVPSIHVVVVDPGVGSDRKPILATGDNHYYIAPDNGVLTKVIETDSIMDFRYVEEEHYMLPRTTETFHGRDIFAPVAGWLSKYFDANLFGDPVENIVRLDLSKPRLVKERVLECKILFPDRFGNLVTNLSMDIFNKGVEKYKSDRVSIRAGSHQISGIKTHYFGVPDKGDALALFGSMETLEISVREGDAEKQLGLHSGDLVYVIWEE